MKREESLRVLTQEQHEERSGHLPIEVDVLISLFFNYVRQTRRNTVLRSYDAEIAITV